MVTVCAATGAAAQSVRIEINAARVGDTKPPASGKAWFARRSAHAALRLHRLQRVPRGPCLSRAGVPAGYLDDRRGESGVAVCPGIRTAADVDPRGRALHAADCRTAASRSGHADGAAAP